MWSSILFPSHKPSVPVLLACLLTSATVGCSGLAGQYRKGVYVSPEGNFRLAARPSSDEPPVIDDSYDEDNRFGTLTVRYMDYSNFGVTESLSYKYWPPEEIARIRALPSERIRAGHTDSFSNYLEHHEGSVLEVAPTFIPTDHQDMLFAVYRVPESSRVFAKDNLRLLERRLGDGRQLDALRGILIFFKGECSYHVQFETPDDTDPPTSAEEIKRQTIALYQRMEFR